MKNLYVLDKQEYRTCVADFAPALLSVDTLCIKYAFKGKNAWKSQPPQEHLEHAFGHLRDLLKKLQKGKEPVFEDFQSLAFRALAALHLQIEQENNREE